MSLSSFFGVVLVPAGAGRFRGRIAEAAVGGSTTAAAEVVAVVVVTPPASPVAPSRGASTALVGTESVGGAALADGVAGGVAAAAVAPLPRKLRVTAHAPTARTTTASSAMAAIQTPAPP